MGSEMVQIEAHDKFRADIYLAAKAVQNQGCRSYGDLEEFGETCMYRDFDGNACFVGHMIEDEHYDQRLERNSVNQEIVLNVLEKSIGYRLTETMMQAIQVLQIAHDCWIYGKFYEKLKVEITERPHNPYLSDLLEDLGL